MNKNQKQQVHVYNEACSVLTFWKNMGIAVIAVISGLTHKEGERVLTLLPHLHAFSGFVQL